MNKDQLFTRNLGLIEDMWGKAEHAYSGGCDEIRTLETGDLVEDGYALRISDGDDLSVEFSVDEIAGARFDPAQKAVIIEKDGLPYRLQFFTCIWPEEEKLCS